MNTWECSSCLVDSLNLFNFNWSSIYSSNILSVEEDPLHLSRWTLLRCRRPLHEEISSIMIGNGPWPATLKTTWHDHSIFSFTPYHYFFSRWPATCFWQISKEALVLHRNGKSIYGQKISWQEPFCPKKNMGLSDNKCDKRIQTKPIRRKEKHSQTIIQY